MRLDRPARGVIVAAGVGCVMCPNCAREPRTGGPPPCDPHTNDGLAVLVVPTFSCGFLELEVSYNAIAPAGLRQIR